jgi:hypothetical protein
VTTPAIPPQTWVDGGIGCPRCGRAARFLVNSFTGAAYLCAGCEWQIAVSTQSPTGTISAPVAALATALPVSSGGTSFTAGMVLYIDTGTASEICTVTATGTATSIPVTPLAKAHASSTAFGQLLAASAFTGVGEAAVPAAPGWGF